MQRPFVCLALLLLAGCVIGPKPEDPALVDDTGADVALSHDVYDTVDGALDAPASDTSTGGADTAPPKADATTDGADASAEGGDATDATDGADAAADAPEAG